MKLITGSNGFLGRSVKKLLEQRIEDAVFFTSQEFDFTSSTDVPKVNGINVIIHCADYYPGLHYTAEHPQEVYEKNVRIFRNLFELARINGVRKVVTIGTTGCYPLTDELLREDMLATECPERTNIKLLGYTLSRFTLFDIARLSKVVHGIDHAHLILPNLYGPGDRFELGKSHLLSSWIRDFTAAKERGDEFIELWGSPDVRREFMYIDDAAIFVLKLSEINLHREILNVSHGLVPTYKEIAQIILQNIDYYSSDRLKWDLSRKNSRMSEAMDTSELQRYKRILPETFDFSEGVKRAVEYYNTARRLQ